MKRLHSRKATQPIRQDWLFAELTCVSFLGGVLRKKLSSPLPWTVEGEM